jgi:hypothetical protein
MILLSGYCCSCLTNTKTSPGLVFTHTRKYYTSVGCLHLHHSRRTQFHRTAWRSRRHDGGRCAHHQGGHVGRYYTRYGIHPRTPTDPIWLGHMLFPFAVFVGLVVRRPKYISDSYTIKSEGRALEQPSITNSDAAH